MTDATTIPLDTIINKVISTTDKSYFGTSNTPLLYKSRTNRILYHPGCFNPPHRGHLAYISHAFYRLPSSLNIVTAIVECTPDKCVMKKVDTQKRDEDVVFAHGERVQLWNKEGEGTAWLWTMSEKNARSFREGISRVASEEGCRVEWIQVFGPDLPFGHGWRGA
jgi:hypothetical protein